MIKRLFYNRFSFIKIILLFLCIGFIFSFSPKQNSNQWIRINQLGYTPEGIKVAVWCSKDNVAINYFELIDSASGNSVFKSEAGKSFGAYGPFTNTYRLNFSSFHTPGKYFLKAGNAVSPAFKIN